VLGFILGLIIIGLIAGFIARALVPGRDSMSIPATIALGIVGSFVGGFLFYVLHIGGSDSGFKPARLIGSIIGAIIALVVYNAVTGRKHARV
jgi:uncharacterized membrane protein YeaQ/YmgE (transglycosylase-associated protein family)